MSQPLGSRRGVGRATLAVLLAAVFLTVIGVSVGVVAGRSARHAAAQRNVADSAERPITPEISVPPSRAAVGSPAAGSKSSAKPSSPAAVTCPTETVKEAGVQLSLVQYVETAGSEVWICKSANGKLYYQGHRKPDTATRYPQDALVQGENALFLTDVTAGQGEYRARHVDTEGRETRYVVTTAYLTITRPSGAEERQNTTRHVP